MNQQPYNPPAVRDTAFRDAIGQWWFETPEGSFRGPYASRETAIRAMHARYAKLSRLLNL